MVPPAIRLTLGLLRLAASPSGTHDRDRSAVPLKPLTLFTVRVEIAGGPLGWTVTELVPAATERPGTVTVMAAMFIEEPEVPVMSIS